MDLAEEHHCCQPNFTSFLATSCHMLHQRLRLPLKEWYGDHNVPWYYDMVRISAWRKQYRWYRCNRAKHQWFVMPATCLGWCASHTWCDKLPPERHANRRHGMRGTEVLLLVIQNFCAVRLWTAHTGHFFMAGRPGWTTLLISSGLSGHKDIK